MSGEIGIIITCINITKQVAEYFNLIEGLEVKIDKLMSSELDVGLYTLKQVRTSERKPTILSLSKLFKNHNGFVYCTY